MDLQVGEIYNVGLFIFAYLEKKQSKKKVNCKNRTINLHSTRRKEIMYWTDIHITKLQWGGGKELRVLSYVHFIILSPQQFLFLLILSFYNFIIFIEI